jgi:hypothetical protein
MRLAVGVIVFAAGMLLGGAANACSVPLIRTLENQTVTGHMTTRSGRTCRISFRSSTGPMHTVEVVQRPAHGTVQVGGHQSIAYKSSANFVGSDSFTYARRGLDKRGNRAVRTIQVNVTVTP